MTSVEQRTDEWIATYGASDACAAHMLCDRHDPAATAMTFVSADLEVSPMSFGELRDRSARLATALAARGIGSGDPVGC